MLVLILVFAIVGLLLIISMMKVASESDRNEKRPGYIENWNWPPKPGRK